MASFRYRGRNARGEAVQGVLEGLSADAVASQLLNTGITPVDIDERRAAGEGMSLRRLLGRERVALVDLIFFCRQMHTLTRAGVPILQALNGLRDSSHNPALARVVASVSEGLDAGLDLTSAFRRHADVFPPLFVSMVQVGETTGNLEQAFLQLAGYLEREKDTRERVRAALRYPVMVLVAITAAMFIINLFVIPAFAKVYDRFGADLPWATQVLISTSGFFRAYWYLLLAAIVAGAFGASYYVRSPRGRYRWDEHKLRMPVIGRVIYEATLARFAHALAIAVRAGVPLVQGFTVVSRAVDNEYIGSRVLQMRDGIERGESITRTATVAGLFPALVVQMISVGEETGAIDEMMQEVGDYYEREVDHRIKNLSAAIEPLLIVAIAVMVLILALGVFLPMWELAGAIKGR